MFQVAKVKQPLHDQERSRVCHCRIWFLEKYENQALRVDLGHMELWRCMFRGYLVINNHHEELIYIIDLSRC